MMRGSPRWSPRLANLGLLAALSLAPMVAARAQQSAPTLPVAPGSRVRVSAANLVKPIVASFLQQRGDSAVFIEDAAGRGIWTIPIGDITKLERSNGERKTNTPYIVRGAVVGGGAGVIGGLVLAATLSPDQGKKYSRGLSAGLGALIGGLIGGGLGSRIGAENWMPVTLPRRMAFGGQPNGLGLRFTF